MQRVRFISSLGAAKEKSLGKFFVPLEVFDLPFTCKDDKLDYFKGRSIEVCLNCYLPIFYANLKNIFFWNQHNMRTNKNLTPML